MGEEKTSIDVKQAASDILTFELTRPVITRLRDRLKELSADSQAKHMPQQLGNVRIWKTAPPKIFISNLSAKIENNVGIITYSVYKKDGENKFVKVVLGKKRSGFDGSEFEVEVAKDYLIEKLVVETIEQYKPIVTKTIKQI